MKRLDLYDQNAVGSALNASERLEANPSCQRCAMHQGVKTVCMPAEDGRSASADGILLVSEYPGGDEDRAGRPMIGVSGRLLRSLLAKWGFADKVVITNALACMPGRRKITPKHVSACRPYVANVARLVQPERIVCLGSTAVESVFGRKPAVLSIRKGFTFHRNEDGSLVPVFVTVNPAAAARNKFVRAAFEADLRWALTCEPPKPRFDAVGWLVEDADDAFEAMQAALAAEWFAWDVETHGRMHDDGFRIECASVAPAGSRDVYVWTRPAMRDKGCRSVLDKLLSHPRARSVTQNGKYDDRSALLDLGRLPSSSYADTRLMSRMLDPNAAAKLEVVAERVGLGGHKAEAKAETAKVVKELKRQAFPPSATTPKGNPRKVKPKRFDVPEPVLAKLRSGVEPMAYAFGYTDAMITYVYNGRDSDTTREYATKVLPEFRTEPDIARVWDLITRDADRAVRWIEHWGFLVDRQATERFAQFCKGKIAESKKILDQHATINWNSPPQLADLLFHQLGLPVVKLTDTDKESTDKDVLEELRDEHPLIPALIDHRRWVRQDTTYATGLLPHIQDDGRVHCSVLLDGTRTGRPSFQYPNLGNIPRAKGAPEAKFARNCYVVPPGYVLLESDQAQVEIRVAALLSEDDVLAQDFRDGIDIHMLNATACCEVAFRIPRKKWDAMSKDERDPYRSIAKTITFGKLYGKSDAGFAREFGCSRSQVEDINRVIWGRYKKLDAWCRRQTAEGIKTGEVWTWWAGSRARRRPLWDVGSPDEAKRSNAINSLVNTPVQGTAADFTNASLWPIVDLFLRENLPAKLVMTVYDSILVEVREDKLGYVAPRVKEIMESHDSGTVPLLVDQKVGRAWGSLVDYRPAEGKNSSR